MFKAWDRKSRLLFIERVEMYIAAGLPVSSAVMQGSAGLSKRQRRSLASASLAIEGGQTVSSSFARELGYPQAVVGIIACGESSGDLSEALKSGRILLEREEELIKKCVAAMTYPAIIACAAMALMVGLVRGILPQIIPLLTGLHASLPLLTRLVIGLSGLLARYGLWASVIAVAYSAIAMALYYKTMKMRLLIQTCCGYIPLIGSLINRYALAVFFQSMGALTDAGMAADAAYEKAIAAISFLPLRNALASTIQAVTRGGSFGTAFAKGMPAYVAPLVSAGEASGNLHLAFSRVAAILNRELDHALKQMTSLIEPIMMIGMGCTVGAIALSIMMPIYDISKTLQH